MNNARLCERVTRECEEIMLDEFSNYIRNLRVWYEGIVGSPVAPLEESKRGIRAKTERFKSQNCNSSNGDDTLFFDAKESFSSTPTTSMNREMEFATNHMLPSVQRREKLPDPLEKEKGVSLWSVIKDSVGKDLTSVCLPVYFNEPLSSLQKCFEEFEYSHLLDQAYQHGKTGDSLMRIMKVAAFAVSSYASSEGRLCKPFNPLLGETYEADYPEIGIRIFSEQVSHHPVILACICEGKGWKCWGDMNLKSKFWGQSIQLDPIGILTLEFEDGEIFQWSKVTTTIHNLILGKPYCNHHGTMYIKGNQQFSCKLKFKECSLLDRKPHQVKGFVHDNTGNKVANLIGEWNESISCKNINLDGTLKSKNCDPTIQGDSLLWKRDNNNKPDNSSRYNLSPFAITLNELTPELQEKLPPTDSRLRPDQRSLENGEYDRANAEKLRLEKRQRMSRKMQENGWKPRWFHKDREDGPYRYIGGYWESREQNIWENCPNIFGNFSDDDVNAAPSNQQSLIQYKSTFP